jgi:surface carbohydrate biosynthesis protein
MTIFGRKISFALPRKNRTVIFDQCNEYFVRQLAGDDLIPSIASDGELYMNPLEVTIAFAMWIRCLFMSKTLQGVGISYRQQVTIARIAARIWLYSPKTVLTFIDNNKAFSALHVFFKDKIVFAALVNGARNYDLGFNLRYDVLFTQGDAEGEMVKKYGHKFNSIIPIGSAKLLLFLKGRQWDATIQKTSQGLCLISQYRPGVEFVTVEDENRYRYTSLVTYLARYCIATKRSITVLGASNAESEKRHVQSLFAGVDMTFIPKDTDDPYSSYSAGLNAEALIVVNSTLGQELLGAGKKVMFANCVADRTSDARIGTYKYVLRSNIFEDFSAMLDEVLAYPIEKFAKDFEAERNYICRSDLAGIKVFQDWLALR